MKWIESRLGNLLIQWPPLIPRGTRPTKSSRPEEFPLSIYLALSRLFSKKDIGPEDFMQNKSFLEALRNRFPNSFITGKWDVSDEDFYNFLTSEYKPEDFRTGTGDVWPVNVEWVSEK